MGLRILVNTCFHYLICVWFKQWYKVQSLYSVKSITLPWEIQSNLSSKSGLESCVECRFSFWVWSLTFVLTYVSESSEARYFSNALGLFETYNHIFYPIKLRVKVNFLFIFQMFPSFHKGPKKYYLSISNLFNVRPVSASVALKLSKWLAKNVYLFSYYLIQVY